MSAAGILPLGHPMARDAFDVSRETIVECAQRAAAYAAMVMDLAQMRDDDGANVMRARLVAEVRGINAAFAAIKAARDGQDPAQAAAAFFDTREAAE